MAYLGVRALAVALVFQTAAAPVLAEGPAAGFSGAYLAGRQARYNGDFDAAAQYFTRALTRDPANTSVLEQAVLAHLSLGQIDRALPVARKISADGVMSQIAQMVMVADEGARGDYNAVLTRIAAEQGVGPLVDGLLKAWAYVGRGDMTAALEAFDAVGEERGLKGFALYHKALALASVGDFGGAEDIYSGRAAGPLQMTRRGVIARCEVLSQLEKNAEALTLLGESFGADLDPGLKAMAARLEAGERLPFTHVTSARDGLAEVFYSVAGALNSEAEDDYTLLYSRVAEHLRPDHIDAILLSANLLEQMGRYELAVETYAKVPRDDPSFHAAELGRAEALRRDGKTDAAVEVLEQLTKSHPDLAIVHVTRGDLMRQLERYGKAVEAYDTALSLYPEEAPEQWFIYYARGIAHERLENWGKAEADFRKSLKLNPEQPQVMNYLGYSLVEKGIKLDEALELIERAVAARPESGYIIDSLGWVLYRMGRYGEAIGHMERAAELMPVDPIVNDHLGDVLWAVDRKREAEFQWRRALSFDPEEKDAARIRRKLDVGLDAVLAEEGAPPLKVANGN